MRVPFYDLVGPVFDLQTWHLAEVPQMARHRRRSMRQGDTGDQEVGSADLLEFFVLAQPVNLGSGSCINGDDRQATNVLFVLFEPTLRPQSLNSIGCLMVGIESALEDLDPADRRERYFIGLFNSLRDASMSPQPVKDLADVF